MARSMATTAAQMPSFSYNVADVNGLKVATRDDGLPTTALSVVIKGGSRYQSTPGVAHALEKFGFKDTAARTGLRMTRESELLGGVLSTQLHRESITYTAQFTKEHLAYFVELLGDVVSLPKLSPYNLTEKVIPLLRLESEAAQANPLHKAFETVHQLAFRRGLGNELLSGGSYPVSREDIANYVRQTFTRENIAIVASGANASEVQRLVAECFQNLPSTTVDGKPATEAYPALEGVATKYFGGEARVATNSNIAHFVAAFPGASNKISEGGAEYTVLANLLGGTPAVKYSDGASPLAVGGGGRAFATNLAYSDAGLFSVVVAAPTENLRNAASKALMSIKDAARNVSADDLKMAINKAKFAVLSANEGRASGLDSVGRAILENGKAVETKDLVAALENVSAESVQKAAAKLLEAKPSVVTVGKVHKLPYYDELL
ncbi:LuxS/MPP-like metallohydrolase [Saitoella complicata NRRL Y-17804]|nr:LuxS/MPP-like metallohydrolase [Saitoella complicata NRRL Y-17804]ODQ53188.1 LuxS/MPP-like metallohydrolase [Saitoella complicata NRRL Y-17804]